NDHSEVLSKIAHPFTNRVLDIALIISCYVIGFVMIAGAGSNLNQQFGLPTWLGALICVLLVIFVSFLDFEKITQIIGIFTPIVIIIDRKSTRLNSSHVSSSYAVFCLKKKNRKINKNKY